MIDKDQIQNALKALAVAGAFMVPLAGFPLAALVAKKLYGDSVSFEKIKEVLRQLIQMKKVQQEEVSFKDWLIYRETYERQDEMSLSYLRINPEISKHQGEKKMLAGDKLKRCLEEKFARINIPVQIIVDPKPNSEEMQPDPNSIKVLVTDRGGDPMTCWMILHRLGHAGFNFAQPNDARPLLYEWYKLYVKYNPKWQDRDLKYPLSKFLMFNSARKTASVIDQWASDSVKKGWVKWAKENEHDIDRPLKQDDYYTSVEPKSYARDTEFEHELVAEFLWHGRIRVKEDPADPFVKENPGYTTKMFEKISETLLKNILSLKGKVVRG